MRLISAPWLVPIDAPPVREGALVIDDHGTILAIGSRSQLHKVHSALPEVRAKGAVLPALVNAHLHLELSGAASVRGAAGQGFIAWAGPLMQQRRDRQGATEIAQEQTAAMQAGQDMVAVGVGAVGDVGNTLAAVPTLRALGLEGIFFHELTGLRDAATGDAIADAGRERDVFDETTTWPSGLGHALAPHAPYSLDPELFRRIFAANARTAMPTSVHVNEDADEVALLKDGSGGWPAVLAAMKVDVEKRVPRMRPLPYLDSLGLFDGALPPLLVHMVFADPDEIALAARHRAHVVLCPRSNLHISGRLPDVLAMHAAGLNLAIGTDSLASSPSLSPWGELAALTAHLPPEPHPWLLRAATLGGAEALGLSHRGSLTPGKRPGLIDVQLPAEILAPGEVLAHLLSTPDPRVGWLH